MTKTGKTTAKSEWLPSGFLASYSQPVVTIFQMTKQRYVRPKIEADFLFKAENFDISCSRISNGTKATKIKNGIPYVGQEMESSMAEMSDRKMYFMKIFYSSNLMLLK